MPRKAFETLSEPMFYVLMALRQRTLCGAEIAEWVSGQTGGRMALGPGTLYTILPKLVEAGAIAETALEGRKRSYAITDRGRQMYAQECERLRQCVADIAAEAAAVPT